MYFKKCIITFNGSSWRVSKLDSQRLYIIGGESPNKNRGLLGCFLFTFPSRLGSQFGHVERKTQDLNISSRYRVYYLHKSVPFTETVVKTKQNKTCSFTLINRTEVYWRSNSGGRGTSHANWVKSIIFGVLPYWLKILLFRKFIKWEYWNKRYFYASKRFLTVKITAA